MLSDCRTGDNSISEVFVVQTGQATDIAKRMRDRQTQAVLKVDSTIMEIQNATLDEVFDDGEVQGIIASLGVGIVFDDLPTGPGTGFDISKLRYGKIIVVSDASPKGKHTRTQILAFLHRYMNPLVAGGFVYVVPPDRWVGMNEEEFEAKVMAPSTRRLIQVPPGNSITETLAFLDSI